VFLGQFPDLVRRHVARDHQHCVVRRVVAVVVVERIGEREGFHLVLPADHRHAVAVVEVLRRAGLFVVERAGVVLGPLVAFLDDDVALGQDVLLVEAEVDHPVAFHLHHQLQPVGGDALEVAGVVVGGEGVVVAPVLGHHL
jgi:hypothetical protein